MNNGVCFTLLFFKSKDQIRSVVGMVSASAAFIIEYTVLCKALMQTFALNV